ncbi:MAG: glycosyltransferase family 4 protein [Cyclobacteriaceae bacterium]
MTGVQRFAFEICKVLKARLENRVEFVAPHCEINREMAAALDVKRVGRLTGQGWEQIGLVRYLHSEYDHKPLLLNLGSTSPYFYKNKITTLHDIAYTVNPKWFSWKFTAWYKFLIPRLLKTSRKVITVSEFSKDQISDYYGVPKSKIEVVYNAVSDVFTPSQSTYVDQAQPYFLTVCSLSPRKNLKRTLEAFELVRTTRPEVKLIVVGDQRLKPFAKYDLTELLQAPNVVVKGYVSDQEMVNLYGKASGFIFTSLYEGFGIPPLEAAAMGCPCVASNVTAMPEVLGDSVCYCDPTSVEDIALAMQKLLEDPKYRRDLIDRGYQNLKRFDWEQSATKICLMVDGLSARQ